MPEIYVAVTSQTDSNNRKLVVVDVDKDSVDDVLARACKRMKIAAAPSVHLAILLGGKLAKIEDVEDFRPEMELILVDGKESTGGDPITPGKKKVGRPRKSPQSSFEDTTTPAVTPVTKKRKTVEAADEAEEKVPETEKAEPAVKIFKMNDLVWAAFAPSKSKAAYWPAYVVNAIVKGQGEKTKAAYSVVDLTPMNQMFRSTEVVAFTGDVLPEDVQKGYKNVKTADRENWARAFKRARYFYEHSNQDELNTVEAYLSLMWKQIGDLDVPLSKLPVLSDPAKPLPYYDRVLALCARALQAIDKYARWLTIIPPLSVDEGYSTPNPREDKNVLKMDTMFGVFLKPVFDAVKEMIATANDKNDYDSVAHRRLAAVLLGWCNQIEEEMIRRAGGGPDSDPFSGLRSRLGVKKKPPTKCDACGEGANKGPCEEGFIECHRCFATGIHVQCCSSMIKDAAHSHLARRWLCKECRVCLGCGATHNKESPSEEGWTDSGRFCTNCFKEEDEAGRCMCCLAPSHDSKKPCGGCGLPKGAIPPIS